MSIQKVKTIYVHTFILLRMEKVTLRTLLTVAFTLNSVNYNNTNSGIPITVYRIAAGGI